jgi:wyosine [tRNA(Phe)-imidazoG37] synthetase (radical SAM superfamily)
MSGRYVFGPVLSGRLGRSLGIDPIGARVCSFDCLYCEAGATLSLTATRRAFAPAARILDELTRWKDEGHEPPDVVTLGGLGEPTLSTEIAAVIAGAKELFPVVPVAVLTNASLLADPAVRADLAGADMVLPSMDTLVEAEYRRLNRPDPALALNAIRGGLLALRAEYRGLIFLEILLLAGVNDTETNLTALTDFVAELKPDRVDVVTMTRPGAYGEAAPVSGATLARFRHALGGAEPPHHAGSEASSGDDGDLARQLESSLARRPQTAAALAKGFGCAPDAIETALARLVEDDRLRRHDMGGETFYLPVWRR